MIQSAAQSDATRQPLTAWRSGVVRLLATLLVLTFVSTSLARADYPTRGTMGYGLSVFQGTDPERFEVEFLGHVEGFGGTGAMLLAKVSGPVVDRTGVQQGMSGSPVYVGGELVGAIMSTWAFASEAIAGIRPIEEMRAVARDLESGDVGQSSWFDGTQLATTPMGESGLAFSAGGFDPSLHASMREVLGAPVIAGAKASAGDGSLDPGDALAVLLVDGDARLFATGTVTERVGDVVTGFGHPFLGVGAVDLPMAVAEVVTVLPSRQISFKIAAAGEVVGALRLDRRAGIAGVIGQKASMVPVTVHVEGGARRGSDEYAFQVARMQGLTPNLVTWTVQTSIADARNVDARTTLWTDINVTLVGGEVLRTRAALAGGSAQQVGAEAALPLLLLESTHEAMADVESVDVRLRFDDEHRAARVVRVLLDSDEIQPGETLIARVEIEPWRGETEWVSMDIRIPDELSPGPHLLHVMDGAEAFREEIGRSAARWERIGPRQIREALALRGPASELVAVLYGPSTSSIVAGVELESLPGSVRAVMGRGVTGQPAQAAAATPLARVSVSTPYVLGGAVRLVLDAPAPHVDRDVAPEDTPTPPREKTSRRGHR